jgi:hypothetical protein
VIEFHNFKGETANVLTTYTMDVPDKYKLLNKLLPFVGITVRQISEELKENKQIMCLPG